MRRRDLLSLGLAAPLLAACNPFEVLARQRTPITVYSPGMKEGHWLRDLRALPQPSAERRVDTLIIGSGIGGLSTAWKLQRDGFKDFLLLAGPEFSGNAAGGACGELRFPLGAHYLPLPTQESTHVREMLGDFSILLGAVNAPRPEYDERFIVHAPEERLLINGHWQDGFLPTIGVPAPELAEQARFFHFVESLKRAKGRDGKLLFALPLALSSQDEEWRALDQLTFATWLTREGYTAPSLRWYLDYCCRDDYGTTTEHISAWAGLHYFACRTGQARNAGDDAVLTWPDGLHPLAQRLYAPVAPHMLPGFALRVQPKGKAYEVLHLDAASSTARCTRITARRIVFATPLHVTAHLYPHLAELGFDTTTHMPAHAPWMVSNFVLEGFPEEIDNTPVSWDNMVYQSRGLGYVVSTHQLIRVARPERTVFSAYQALNQRSPVATRQWLAEATQTELVDEAACDLVQVYGSAFWRRVTQLHITLRGHAMASPGPGFLHNPGLQALREADQSLLFAHADLSSLSIFEEASWWGYQAATRILNA